MAGFAVGRSLSGGAEYTPIRGAAPIGSEQTKRRCCILGTTCGLTVHGLPSNQEKPSQDKIQAICFIRTSFPTCLRSIEIISLVWTSIPTSKTNQSTPGTARRSSLKDYPEWPSKEHSNCGCPPKRRRETCWSPSTLQFPDCARSRTVSTIGESAGGVRLQDPVAPRQGRWRQCSILPGRVSTRRLLNSHERFCLGQGCKRDRMVRLHASSHPGISDGAEGTLRGPRE
jgi:hypothetical protein